MNNMLKTIFVVSVMGGALYGAYVLLNENEFRSRQQPAQNDEGGPTLDITGGDFDPLFGSGEPSSDTEPAPSDFETTSPAPGIPEFPPDPRSFPPTAVTPGGMTPIPSAGPGEAPSNAAGLATPLPPNTTSVDTTPGDPYAATSTPSAVPPSATEFKADVQYFPPAAESRSEEPSDLAVPPELASTDSSAAGQGDFRQSDLQAGEFQRGDFSKGASTPVTGAPEFDGGSAEFAAVSNSSASGGSAAIEAARQSYLRAVETAKGHVAQKNYRDALAALSPIYGNPDLPSPEKEELGDLLDALAAKVIYSPEHLHQAAYVVQPGDTLDSVAASYSITPEFLARINGLDPVGRSVGEPGSSLKVVRGPFRAEVRLKSNVAGTLTLYLGELYAGRFDVELGQDNPPFPGKYKVHDKQIDRPFYTAAGELIPAESPENPYGGRWIDLGSGISLHGGPATAPAGGRLGCMSLPGEGQASDLFAILSLSSTVEVRQ